MEGVLVIDTAGPVIGIAYGDAHHTEFFEQRVVRGSDGILVAKLAEFISRYEVTLIGVCVGPGAFTGLRVGVSTALGFALARGIKVVPLSSLQTRALIAKQAVTLAVLDARKSRVYAEFFDASKDIPISLGPARDIDINALVFPPQFYAVGEGVERYRDVLVRHGAMIPLDACRSPVLDALALTWLLRDTALDPADIQLNYIRPPDAQIPKNMGVAVGKAQK